LFPWRWSRLANSCIVRKEGKHPLSFLLFFVAKRQIFFDIFFKDFFAFHPSSTSFSSKIGSFKLSLNHTHCSLLAAVCDAAPSVCSRVDSIYTEGVNRLHIRRSSGSRFVQHPICVTMTHHFLDGRLGYQLIVSPETDTIASQHKLYFICVDLSTLFPAILLLNFLSSVVNCG